MRIGVFDSGVGGQAVVVAIKKALPSLEILYADDKANLPYGTKGAAELLRLVTPRLQFLVDSGCQLIVIACNTVTTSIISRLRAALPVPLIGMEPMIKPAANLTRSGVIAVCATPTTLATQRYLWLKQTYATTVRVLEPDCSDWAYMIERQQLDRQKIQSSIDKTCRQGADVIVLGCTHYHWIEELIKKVVAGRATVLQPEAPVIAQLKRVLKQLA